MFIYWSWSVKKEIKVCAVAEQNIIDVIIMRNSQHICPPQQPLQLNYHARKKGKHTKTHKYSSSPLHDRQLNTLLITSRSRIKSNTSQPEPLSDSIIWLNELAAEEPDKILIVESEGSAEMLIVESDQQEQTIDLCQLKEGRQQSNQSPRSFGQTAKTSILICEESEDLLWINKQQYEQNSPQTQERHFHLDSTKCSSQVGEVHPYGRNTHRRELSNIEELSSQAEEDQEDNLEQQKLGRAPISPQTQPLIKLKPIIDYRSESDTKWPGVEQERSSGLELKWQKSQRLQHFAINVRIQQLFPKRRIKLDKKLIVSTLKEQKNKIFDEQLLQLNQLAEQTQHNNRDNLQQIISILQEEQHKLQQQIDRQQKLLLKLKCSLRTGTQIVRPAHLDPNQSQLSQQEQIKLNNSLLRRMVALASRK